MVFNDIFIIALDRDMQIWPNGELEDKYVADFFATLRDYYYIAAFTLDSVAEKPKKTLTQIKQFDLLVIANPTEQFTEEEKYILDQSLA